jgi:uncharacterized protein YegP (UPF0339 family)
MMSREAIVMFVFDNVSTIFTNQLYSFTDERNQKWATHHVKLSERDMRYYNVYSFTRFNGVFLNYVMHIYCGIGITHSHGNTKVERMPQYELYKDQVGEWKQPEDSNEY